MNRSIKENRLAKAMDAFSRSTDFDLPIYRELIKSYNCNTIIEIGAGTGRLVGEWLSFGFRVLAVEPDAELQLFLHNRFSSFIKTGALQIVASLKEIAGNVDSALLIAPFNVAFHFAEPSDFAGMLKEAATIGVERAYLDVDNISVKDWEYSFANGRVSVKVDSFIEEVKVLASRRLQVSWSYQQNHSLITKFNLSLHAIAELTAAIYLRLPEAIVREERRTLDQGGTDVSFLRIELNSP